MHLIILVSACWSVNWLVVSLAKTIAHGLWFS